LRNKLFLILYCRNRYISILESLVKYGYIFSYFVINSSSQYWDIYYKYIYNRYVWQKIRKKLFDNYNKTLLLGNYVVIFYRVSILYGKAFTKITIVSTRSRQIHYSWKNFVKIDRRFKQCSDHKTYIFNTKYGLISHLEIIQVKCGGSLIFYIE